MDPPFRRRQSHFGLVGADERTVGHQVEPEDAVQCAQLVRTLLTAPRAYAMVTTAVAVAEAKSLIRTRTTSSQSPVTASSAESW